MQGIRTTGDVRDIGHVKKHGSLLSAPPEMIPGQFFQSFLFPALPVSHNRESSAVMGRGVRGKLDLKICRGLSLSGSLQRSGGKSDAKKKAKGSNFASRALVSIESGFRGDGLDGFEQGKAMIRVRRGGNV